MSDDISLDEFKDMLVHAKVKAMVYTSDMVNVVRCRDCKECYYASNRCPSERSWVCGRHGIDVVPDWFCADGERREDE